MKLGLSHAPVERLGLLSLALSALALFVGYAWNGRWIWALFFLILGSGGWLLPKMGARWLGSIVFAVFTAAAGLGAANGMPAMAMLISILAALAYWDLDAFRVRLARVPSSENTRLLEKLHLQRLAWVLGLGLALSLPGLWFQIKINLAWAMLLSLLIVIGIRRGIGFIRNNEEKL